MERMGEDDDDVIVSWIRPVHLDDDRGNPDPAIAESARSAGIDVDRVLSEEVGTEATGSSSQGGGDTDDGGDGGDGGNIRATTSERSARGTSSHEGGMPEHAPWTEE